MFNHDNKIFLNKELGILISGIEFYRLEHIEGGETGNFWHGAERYGFEGIHEEHWFNIETGTKNVRFFS